MRNETARREIESLDYYLQNHTNDYSEESHTAMMMAIKALEQEPYEKFESTKDHIYKLAGDYKCWDNRLTEDEAVELYHILEQEPKTGHWIAYPKGVYAHLVCDKCLSNAPYDCKTNYCPNCGARMVEPQESEE